jgi:hypothetical protein
MPVVKLLFFFFAAACLAGSGGALLLWAYQAWRSTRNSRQPFATLGRVAETYEESDLEALHRLMEVIDECIKALDPDHARAQHR